MIYVTQGHPKGIGLEVFLKSLCLLPRSTRRLFTLILHPNSPVPSLPLPQVLYLEDSPSLPSRASFELALEKIEKGDILITLPSTKEEIPGGHTAALRRHFDNPLLPMVFYNSEECHLLLTDHLPLREVVASLNPQKITHKVLLTLEGLHQHFGQKITMIYLSGVNPHAGEKGLLGTEEELLYQARDLIKKERPTLEVFGPLSGDSLHRYQGPHILKVFSFHDQSLCFFKGHFDWFGLNLTFGLPFLRISVDHGTGSDLFGQNRADYRGSFYQLLTALKVHRAYSH